jgi:hypothetical protein
MEHLPAIESWVIAHKDQKYNTAGDYWETSEGHNGTWAIRLSELSDWRYEFLVLIHELVEMALTKHAGIDWKDIDNFDTIGAGKDHPDPGSLKSAPYYNEHKAAEMVEKIVASALKVKWEEYNQALDALEY